MDEALVKKLRLAPGMRVMVINAPEGFLDRLTPLPEGATFVEQGPADWVMAFMRSKAEVDALAPQSIEAVKRDGYLWLCYPKGGGKAGGRGTATDINRDTGWDVMNTTEWGPVTQVSLDETWSAVRWRPEADVKRKSGSVWSRQ
jgi:hypothetical protein